MRLEETQPVRIGYDTKRDLTTLKDKLELRSYDAVIKHLISGSESARKALN